MSRLPWPAPEQERQMANPNDGPDGAGVAALLAVVVCCGGHALLAGGIVTLGVAVRNVVVVTAGAVVLVGALCWAFAHRRRASCRVPAPTHESGAGAERASSDDGG